MAKTASIGEMRTKIIIKALLPEKDADGFPDPEWIDMFSAPVWCLWVNAHGRELYETMREEMREVATITMRYSAKVDVRCRIWRENETQDDDHAYEILSIDNIRDGRNLMEIKVKRLVVG